MPRSIGQIKLTVQQSCLFLQDNLLFLLFILVVDVKPIWENVQKLLDTLGIFKTCGVAMATGDHYIGNLYRMPILGVLP